MRSQPLTTFWRETLVAEIVDGQIGSRGGAKADFALDAGRAFIALFVENPERQSRWRPADRADRADAGRIDAEAALGGAIEFENLDAEPLLEDAPELRACRRISPDAI